MKILHIAYEFPLPTIHGGRLDIWQHICGFHELGYPVFHISWSDSKRNEEIEDKVEDYLIIEKTQSRLHQFGRLLNCYKMPSLAYDRRVNKELYLRILNRVSKFKPDLIFLDVIYGGELAIKLKNDLRIPLIVRSQNIEHLYIREQFKNAKNSKLKIALWMALQNLKKFEFKIFKSANLIADISEKDLAFWQNNGFKNIKWLPPIFVNNNIETKDLSANETLFDVVFFGNLNTPNNIEGIKWFVQDVLPIIMRSNNYCSISVLIMGSNPSSDLIESLKCCPNIKLIPNVTNPNTYLENAKIMINPVRFGSGVKMKTIEVLFSDKQYVTTSEGIKGLPTQLFEDVFFVADSKEKFAEYVVDILNGEQKNLIKRATLRSQFSVNNLKNILCSAKPN